MYLLRFLKLRTILIALTMVMSQYVLAAVGYNTVRLDNNSDWWSLINPSSPNDLPNDIKPLKRKISDSNCQILGVKLGVKDDQPMYNRIMAKLGRATVVARGDAHYSRAQVSYVSTKNKDNVYLVFEEGEMDTSFYVFTGERSWKGSNYAASSALISGTMATASGLHLGQSPEQIIAILGKPNFRNKSELYYSFLSKVKIPEKDLKKSWQKYRTYNQNMSYEQYRQFYEFESHSVVILTRFDASKLIYLAVSRSDWKGE